MLNKEILGMAGNIFEGVKFEVYLKYDLKIQTPYLYDFVKEYDAEYGLSDDETVVSVPLPEGKEFGIEEIQIVEEVEFNNDKTEVYYDIPKGELILSGSVTKTENLTVLATTLQQAHQSYKGVSAFELFFGSQLNTVLHTKVIGRSASFEFDTKEDIDEKTVRLLYKASKPVFCNDYDFPENAEAVERKQKLDALKKLAQTRIAEFQVSREKELEEEVKTNREKIKIKSFTEEKILNEDAKKEKKNFFQKLLK